MATAYFEAIAARDLDGMVEQWAPGGTDHFYGMADLPAPEGVRHFFSEMFATIPDLSLSVLDMVAYGDRAAVRWRATGTFDGRGKFQGLAPTGASVVLEGCDLLTIEDGLIQENFAYTNQTELARQMGAMPPSGSVGDRAMLGAINARTAGLAAVRRLRAR